MASTEKSAISVLEKEILDETKSSDSLIQEVQKITHQEFNDVIKVVFEKNKEAAQKYLPKLILINSDGYSENEHPVPGKERQSLIRWINDTAHGYERGVESGMPMVILFADNDALGNRIKQELAKSELQQFAQQAIFIHGVANKDEHAAKICTALKLESTPIITVLRPNNAVLHEVGRIGWTNNTDVVAKHLSSFIQAARRSSIMDAAA